MLEEKEVIRPGTYWYRDQETGQPRKLVVTPELTRYWHEQGNAMLANGLTVPVPVEHDFNAHPMTPAEKLLNNAGWIDGYFFKKVKNRDGTEVDALFSKVDIKDEELRKKLPHTIKWTSPWINSFVDGNGKEWKNVISHLALTTRPRIIEQEPFGSVAAALSMAEEVKVDATSKVSGAGGLCLSRAGLLLGDGPAYPMAFSMMTGIPLATDSSGHEHDARGRFGSGKPKSIRTKKGRKSLHDVSSKANELSKKAHASGSEEHHKEAATAHFNAAEEYKRSGDMNSAFKHYMKGNEHSSHEKPNKTFSTDDMSVVDPNLTDAALATAHDKATGQFTSGSGSGSRLDHATASANEASKQAKVKNTREAHGAAQRLHKDAARAHEEEVQRLHDTGSIDKKAMEHHTSMASYHHKKHDEHMKKSGWAPFFSTNAALGVPPPKPPTPNMDDDETESFNDADGDEGGGDDAGGVQMDDDPTNDNMVDLDDDGSGDVSMTEVLCDLLGALGIHCEHSGDESTFKRSIYNAAMTKIHELTGKAQAGSEEPNGRDNPPGQPPKNPDPNNKAQQMQKQNPILQQEQQPMYMSLDEINKLPDPMRGLALSMHNQMKKMEAAAAVDRKKLEALNASKLAEEDGKRQQRVALLGKLSPRAKPMLDQMLASPAMALSMGDGGKVVDPMAATLELLEKGLADMPMMLTTDQSAFSTQPQPTDASMMDDAKADALADSMARAMGCPPQSR